MRVSPESAKLAVGGKVPGLVESEEAGVLVVATAVVVAFARGVYAGGLVEVVVRWELDGGWWRLCGPFHQSSYAPCLPPPYA
jgi:hypothetical protein